MTNKTLEIEEGSVVILNIDSQLVEGTVSRISPCGQQVKVEFEPPSQWFNRSMVLDVIGVMQVYPSKVINKVVEEEEYDYDRIKGLINEELGGKGKPRELCCICGKNDYPISDPGDCVNCRELYGEIYTGRKTNPEDWIGARRYKEE